MDSVTILMAALLFGGVYLMLFQSTRHLIYNRKMLPVLAIVEFLICCCAAGTVALLFIYFTYNPVVIYGALLIVTLAVLIGVLRFYIVNRRTNNYIAFTVLGIYLAFLVYLTIGVRVTLSEVSTVIKMEPFVNLRLALQMKSLLPLEHELHNMLLFLPLGVLIPMLNRKKQVGAILTVLCGMLVSTGIETIQLAGRLGECDINDIISNTLGAVIGYIIWKVIATIRRNWKF